MIGLKSLLVLLQCIMQLEGYDILLKELNFMKVGLQGHRVRDEADLEERINAFKLLSTHATAYCRHIANYCVALIDRVRVFDN